MTTMAIFIDADQVHPVDRSALTDQEKVDRIDAASDALFASVFDAPKAGGEKAQTLIEARQMKRTAELLAELFG